VYRDHPRPMSDDVAGRAWRPGARPACVVPAQRKCRACPGDPTSPARRRSMSPGFSPGTARRRRRPGRMTRGRSTVTEAGPRDSHQHLGTIVFRSMNYGRYLSTPRAQDFLDGRFSSRHSASCTEPDRHSRASPARPPGDDVHPMPASPARLRPLPRRRVFASLSTSQEKKNYSANF
jgi:hypothetical protein